MKVREVRVIYSYLVRNVCEEHGYYTCGNNDDYDNMLEMVEKIKRATTSKLYAVAQNIAIHSDCKKFYCSTPDDMITMIMYHINKDACRIVFEAVE